MKDFPQKYKASAVEDEVKAFWGSSDVYTWDPELPSETNYVIDTPPPTVSGTLHVGHVYSYTQADIVARYFRMRGRNVLYPIGWDDNGLPTERLVEKVRKVRGGAMGREEFIAICNDVIPKYEEQFRDLFSTLALSVDWSREYQTISPESRAISQLSFIDLYEKGLIEQRLEPSLWDPADRTAIAQAEMEEMERDSFMNTITFAIEGEGEGGAGIQIATTRPELIAGCGAVMIHPEHPRAAELLGRNAVTPLYGVPVPFIADEHVDPEKGTGMVMCCTFGDVTDIQWYKTHGLPLRVVIDNAGKMKSDLPIGSDPAWPSVDAAQAQATVEALQGKKVNEARKLILEQLQEAGVLNGQEKIRQVVPVAERSGAPLEIIVTPQWFIRTLEYRDQILAKGQEITWHPEYMFNRFETWVQGLKWDWCISRQRHFGVPIPVWISQRAGEEGKVLLPAADALPVDPLVDLPEGYSRDEVEPVKDVMDTWATSSLTPQLTTRSITPERGYDLAAHERLFPSSMRPQAHEIIRTWAFYTIVKALHHQNDVPWRDICISGWCLASDGSKMSKSKGNIIDPLRLIADNGVDPVRYWTGTSRLGNDTALSPNTLKQGRRLVTKLWNAARLAHMSLGGSAPQGTLEEALQSKDISHPIDLWLIGELARTASEATEAFDRYEYAQALKGIETFFWSVFCDNYLELVKWRTGPESAASEADQASARTTLYFATTAVLRLFAPFVPYVTEKVYDLFVNEEGGERASVHARGAWPEFDAAALPPACPFADALLDVMTAVRKIKSDLGVSIKTPLGAVHVTPDPEAGSPVDLAALEPVLEDLRRVLNVEAIVFTAAQGNADDLVAASSGGLTATAQKPAEAPAD